MSDVQLLGKTEIWMQGVHLSDADLPELARRVASVLALPDDKVFVTDVREALVVLDVLMPGLSGRDVFEQSLPGLFGIRDGLHSERRDLDGRKRLERIGQLSGAVRRDQPVHQFRKLAVSQR